MCTAFILKPLYAGITLLRHFCSSRIWSTALLFFSAARNASLKDSWFNLLFSNFIKRCFRANRYVSILSQDSMHSLISKIKFSFIPGENIKLKLHFLFLLFSSSETICFFTNNYFKELFSITNNIISGMSYYHFSSLLTHWSLCLFFSVLHSI